MFFIGWGYPSRPYVGVSTRWWWCRAGVCVGVRMGVCGRRVPMRGVCGRAVVAWLALSVWPWCGRVLCVVGVGLSWLLCGRARVWAKNDSSVVWFVNLGVSWLNFRELSVVDSGFVF